jgi:hypothetical protein
MSPMTRRAIANSGRIAFGFLLCLSIAPELSNAFGTELSKAVMRLADDDIERGFWNCDSAAATGHVDAATGAECAAITDELLRRRFAGRFDDLIRWWQSTKQAQHGQLAVDAEARSQERSAKAMRAQGCVDLRRSMEVCP